MNEKRVARFLTVHGI